MLIVQSQSGRKIAPRAPGLLRARVIGALALAGLVVISPARGETVVVVKYSPLEGAAVKNCAVALRDGAKGLHIHDLKLILDSSDERRDDKAALTIDVASRSEYGSGTLGLMDVPFLFRDPAHVQAFLQSDLYRDLRAASRGGLYEWLAAAYGGFHQLFSTQNAFTEPKHFYMRWIGGPSSLTQVYGAFAGIGDLRGGIDAAAELMLRDSDKMAAVEAPLIDALAYRFDQRARFVNMMFSISYPVTFSVENNTLPGAAHARLIAWADAAAQSCSAANFQAERDVLEKLKQAGLQIVAVDRAAFVEAGWRFGIERFAIGPTVSWSVEDLDRVVRMGAEAPVRLPSALLSKLSAKNRQALLSRARRLNKERQRRALADKMSGRAREKSDALWWDGVARLVELIEKTDPPNAEAQGASSRDRPMVDDRFTSVESLAQTDKAEARKVLDLMKAEVAGKKPSTWLAAEKIVQFCSRLARLYGSIGDSAEASADMARAAEIARNAGHGVLVTMANEYLHAGNMRAAWKTIAQDVEGAATPYEVYLAFEKFAPLRQPALAAEAAKLIEQLGLIRYRSRTARTSAGVATFQLYGAVRLTVQGRECTADVAEVPDECPVLIGQVPLELLDFVVDPAGRRLIGNPAHGGEQMLEMY